MAIAAYDEVMRDYYANRSNAKIQGWSEEMTGLLMKPTHMLGSCKARDFSSAGATASFIIAFNFDLRTTVHHHVHAGIGNFGSFFTDDIQLQPQCSGTDRNGIAGYVRALVCMPKHHHFNPFRDIEKVCIYGHREASGQQAPGSQNDAKAPVF